MIKITQLLKDSLLTYRLNLNKIFQITLPILILSVIGEYYLSIFTQIVDNEDFSNISYLLTIFSIYFIFALIVALYLGPVLNRAIQKKEDGDSFNVNTAYVFQNKNILKWIMINVWGILYMFWTLLSYIIVSVLLLKILTMYSSNPVAVTIIAGLIGLTVLTGIILNIHKFVLYKNIFFSKDHIKARDAVRESIKIGTNKKREVWMLILALIILTITMMVVYSFIGFVLSLLAKFVPENIMLYIEIAVPVIVSVSFFLPLMSIIASKGYVKIRG